MWGWHRAGSHVEMALMMHRAGNHVGMALCWRSLADGWLQKVGKHQNQNH